MWRNTCNDGDMADRVFKDEVRMMNNFEAAHRLLNCGEKSLDERCPYFRQKLDLFFIDYEMIPLLVQECYLNAFRDRKELADVEAMAEAADMISLGDELNIKVRGEQNWALLPNMGMFSSVAPCLIIQGHSLYPNFPQWLGKYMS
jgi:replication factor C subunit 1